MLRDASNLSGRGERSWLNWYVKSNLLDKNNKLKPVNLFTRDQGHGGLLSKEYKKSANELIHLPDKPAGIFFEKLTRKSDNFKSRRDSPAESALGYWIFLVGCWIFKKGGEVGGSR